MKSENLSSGARVKTRMQEIASELIREYRLPPETKVEAIEVDEEKCWEEAYKDFEGGAVRLGLRAKLFTQLNGDALKVKIEFIKVRAQELIELKTEQATDAIRCALDAVLATKQEDERIELARKKQESSLGFTEEGNDIVIKVQRECRPLLEKLVARKYEVISETILPNNVEWTVRSKTNGVTYHIGSIDELQKLVF